MYKICAETRIAATAKTVYGIIADLPNYEKWNPWNLSCEGSEGSVVKEGAIFTVNVQLNGKRMIVQHKILKMQPYEKFVWCDLGWFTRFAYGERSRTIRDAGNGQVDCCVELSISGPLSWVAYRLYGESIRKGMAMELEGLKKYAESVSAE